MSKEPKESPSSRNQFALLVEEVQDYAIFLLSPTGTIRSWNLGAARIMGYAAGEIVGEHFSRLYPAADIESGKPDRELKIATAAGRVEDEGWRVRSNGERFWANTVITALRDNGELVGFAKVTRDLTERRKAEERLRQSEEMFRLLVSSVNDYAIFMLDPDGNVTTWNAGAHRIKGYEAEEIIGRHFSAFYTEEDRRAHKPEQNLATARKRGSVEDIGWRVRKDGTMFWANVVITAVHDESGQLRGFAKVTRDVTAQKTAEEMREALLEQREARLRAEEDRSRAEASYVAAQEANRAKDEFLMTLSHELRTPMTAILGWARLLQSIEPDDPMFAEAVAAIGRSARLQAELIEDVLDISRIVSGKLRLTRETADVERLVKNAVDSVRPTADAKQITMTVSIEQGIGSVVVDTTRIQQVVWNLLTNAVKFTPKRGLVEVIVRRTGSQLQITVRDNGEGIERQFLPHIFEPFRQAENPSTRVHGGLGLGLSIVRYLVEAHGGTVAAESAGRGSGSTFTIMLPIAATATNAVGKSSRHHGELRTVDPHKLSGARILIVDDDAETRSVVRAVLRQAGASVTAVESVDDAIVAFDRDRPALVLTDIAMPGTDGYELLRILRGRDGEHVKIIALTAFPPGTRVSEQREFDRYLLKPIDPVDLVEALADVARAQR